MAHEFCLLAAAPYEAFFINYCKNPAFNFMFLFISE